MRVRILSKRIKDNYIDVDYPLPPNIRYLLTPEENILYNWPKLPNVKCTPKYITLTRMSGCDAGVPEEVVYVDMDSFKESPIKPDLAATNDTTSNELKPSTLKVKILSRRIKNKYVNVKYPPPYNVGYSLTLEGNKSPKPIRLIRVMGYQVGLPDKFYYADIGGPATTKQ